jgi:hypothetical protein
MDRDRGSLVSDVVSDGRSRRKVLSVVLGSIVGLIGMHKDNPTRFIQQHKDNPTLAELVPPTRPIDRLTG